MPRYTFATEDISVRGLDAAGIVSASSWSAREPGPRLGPGLLRRCAGAVAFFLCSSIVAAGCIISPDDGDDTTTDVHSDRACPSGEPHLIIGMTPLIYDADSAIARLDSSLRPCRGRDFIGDEGDITSVSGTRRGHDLVGFYSGKFFLVDGNEQIWGLQSENSRLSVGSIFTMGLAGSEVAGVVWYTSSNWGDTVTLVSLEGDELTSYDASHSLIGAGPSLDGSENRFSGLINWEGVQHYRTESGASTLGATDERQVAAPRAGQLNELSVADGRAMIAAEGGILYWSDDETHAFLGPIRCAWPASRGGEIPDGEEEYLAVAQDLESDHHFLAAVSGTLEGNEDRGSYIFRINTRGECELVVSADEAHRIISISWSGL